MPQENVVAPHRERLVDKVLLLLRAAPEAELDRLVDAACD